VRTTFVVGAGLGRFATDGVGFGAGVEVDGLEGGFVPGKAPVGSWAATLKEEKKLDRGRTIIMVINILFIAVLLKI
jgi:hypothetical protein